MKSKKLLERKEENQQNMVFQKPKKTAFQEVGSVKCQCEDEKGGGWEMAITRELLAFQKAVGEACLCCSFVCLHWKTLEHM